MTTALSAVHVLSLCTNHNRCTCHICRLAEKRIYLFRCHYCRIVVHVHIAAHRPLLMLALQRAFYQYIISILIHMHRMQSAMFYWCDYLGLTLTYACGLLNMFLVLCLYLHLYSD